MDVLTPKDEMLQIIAAEHAAWQALLAAIGEDRMALPGAAGPDWTVKDVVAHLTAWRRRSCDRMEAALAQTPLAPPPWPADPDEDSPDGTDRINDWFFQAARRQSLAEVLAESEAIWARLESLVRALPEAALQAPQPLAGVPDRPLGPAVLNGSLEHLHEHVGMLATQGWRQGRPAGG